MGPHILNKSSLVKHAGGSTKISLFFFSLPKIHFGKTREISPNSGILPRANFFDDHRTSKCLAVDVRCLVINVLSLYIYFLGLLSTQCYRAGGLSVDTVAVIYLLSYIYISEKPIDSLICFGSAQVYRKILTTLTFLKIK